jgi:glycosyltransferase involved in cell wall biosynthesis
MLGWEFPPFISGGLGTACYGLTRALNEMGHRIIFVLPQPINAPETAHVQIRTPSDRPGALKTYNSYRLEEFQNVEFHAIPSAMQPYSQSTPGGWQSRIHADQRVVAEPRQTVVDDGSPEGPGAPASHRSGGGIAAGHYGGNMFADIQRYAEIAIDLARGENFDIVHAHDWMTFPAGLAVARTFGRPLVVQIHSTEFDRSGENVDRRIYQIEREGVATADRVIAVSYFTRNILINRYAADADRIDVVYNAIDNNGGNYVLPPPIRRDEKIVLFLGRITMQKGPEYFLAAAKAVLQFEKNVRFVMAGSGDMIRRSIELAAELGIGHKVVFTGFLRGEDVARVFRMADLYVMPSVSEPFGIAPLEALANDVPALISRQSGVSEILSHVLKVDFWDINEMANKIVAVLRHPPLQSTLREHGNFEIRKLTWRGAAENCTRVYEKTLSQPRRQVI